MNNKKGNLQKFVLVVAIFLSLLFLISAPNLQLIFDNFTSGVFYNNTNATSLGISILYNGTSQSGYNGTAGDFRSLIFYNDTSSRWNITFDIANSSGRTIDTSDGNLVAYLSLDQHFSTNVYADALGSHNGTPTGTTNTSGVSSGAIGFDGNDYISVSNLHNTLSETSDGSWSVWVKLNDATPASSQVIMGFGDTDANERLHM